MFLLSAPRVLPDRDQQRDYDAHHENDGACDTALYSEVSAVYQRTGAVVLGLKHRRSHVVSADFDAHQVALGEDFLIIPSFYSTYHTIPYFSSGIISLPHSLSLSWCCPL